MWKDAPQVISVQQDANGIIDARVRFVNPPAQPRNIAFHGVENLANLKLLVAAQAKAWDTFDAALTGIPAGAIDITPVPPPPPPTPTQDQIDRETFSVAYRKLQAIKRAVDVGMFPISDPLYTQALSDATAAFKPGYEVLL